LTITETTSALARFDGGTFTVYEAKSGARAPGLVVVSSGYGITDDLRATMTRYAARGFIVAAPEMFSRSVPGALGQSDAGRAAARARLEGFDFDAGLADVQTVIEALRARPDCTGTVAVLGYCFGGEFAYLATTRFDAAAAVAFHGVGIGKHLAEAHGVAKPMSLHFGEDDRFISLDEVSTIEAAYQSQPQVEIYRYPGAKHGFAQADVPAYDAQAAQLSEERAFRLLEQLR
jgi:carboxymethylenebutenolidase